MPFEVDGISHVDEKELKEILERSDENIYVVDVREPEEYVEAHIPGVPLVPMGTIPEQMERMDKNAEYVFVCRSGSRSFNVAQYLKHNGFERVHNYAGGMLGWSGETSSGAEHVPDAAAPEQLQRKK